MRERYKENLIKDARNYINASTEVRESIAPWHIALLLKDLLQALEGGTHKTLRDEIAIAAMQGIIAQYGLAEFFSDNLQADAYRAADVMLKQRDIKE